MTRNRVGIGFVAAFFIATLGLPSCTAQESTEPMTTVFVVRHAEKVDDSEDPDLSQLGAARARLLDEMLAEVPVTALYATQFKRTQQTLAPLAARTGLAIEQIPAGETGRLVDAIGRRRGEVVVTAGHSNTVPAIVNALAGTDYEDLSEQDYDNLFIVTLGASGKNAVQLQFRAQVP